MYKFLGYKLMRLDKCTHSCNHSSQDREQGHHPWKLHHSPFQSIPFSSQTEVTTLNFQPLKWFDYSRTLYKWYYKSMKLPVFDFFCSTHCVRYSCRVPQFIPSRRHAVSAVWLYHNLFIYLLIAIWVFYILDLLWIKQLRTFLYESLHGHLLSF